MEGGASEAPDVASVMNCSIRSFITDSNWNDSLARAAAKMDAAD
jgi:hypothetical protein